MTAFLITVLAIYGLTKIITETYAMKWFRSLFRSIVWEVLPSIMCEHMVRWFEHEDKLREEITTDSEDTAMDGRELKGYDMISCFVCMAAWVTIPICLTPEFIAWKFFAAYGAAVFLTTQER